MKTACFVSGDKIQYNCQFWLAMLENLLAAIALVFVFEGILPFAVPQKWRDWMLQVSRKDDRSVRVMGLASMIFGALLLSAVHHLM